MCTAVNPDLTNEGSNEGSPIHEPEDNGSLINQPDSNGTNNDHVDASDYLDMDGASALVINTDEEEDHGAEDKE